jgi:hypothetical protein
LETKKGNAAKEKRDEALPRKHRFCAICFAAAEHPLIALRYD